MLRKELNMDSRRAFGLLIAVISAVLVVLAGRSCAKDIERQNQKNNKNTSQVQQTVEIITISPNVPVTAQPGITAAVTPEPATDLPVPATLPPGMDQPDPTAPSEEYIPTTPDGSIDPEFVPETTTRSMLDEFWDSEHPSYLDPYGFLDGGGYTDPTSVRIEIG